jgi:GTP cyclohydrolase II
LRLRAAVPRGGGADQRDRGSASLPAAGRAGHRPVQQTRAYALQDAGLDTYQANNALGFAEDARDYTAAAQMLGSLGITRLDLLTNNPDKVAQLRDLGVRVRHAVPTGVFASESNLRYLHANAELTQHTIQLPQAARPTGLAG